jgi:hypothetical protein
MHFVALKDKQNEKILYSAFTGQDGTFEIKGRESPATIGFMLLSWATKLGANKLL